MIVQCPDCSTRYRLEPDLVPRERIRVRCPKCRYVFALDGRIREEEPAGRPSRSSASVPPVSGRSAGVESSGAARIERTPGYGEIEFDRPAPVPAAPSGSAEPSAPPSLSRGGLDLEIERSSLAQRPMSPPPSRSASGPRARAKVERAPSGRVATAAPPGTTSATDRRADPAEEKARRLARALVSDILVYNRESRDKALAEGTLVQTLGQEIKKSWELYKERVSPEMASQTNFFREALNEILADGQKIF
jgi:predicted Zn finger-like uncharacterized protein